MTTFTIDCDECVMQDTAACSDCLVTYLCDLKPEHMVTIDAAEARVVRMLHGAGLVPALRHQRRASCRGPGTRVGEC